MLAVPISYFPRLLKASDAQLKRFVISGGGTGLHWVDEPDEDIGVAGLLLSTGDRTTISQSAPTDLPAGVWPTLVDLVCVIPSANT
jgi:hypothetical protein